MNSKNPLFMATLSLVLTYLVTLGLMVLSILTETSHRGAMLPGAFMCVTLLGNAVIQLLHAHRKMEARVAALTSN